MTPRLDCLPAAQRRLWPELAATPDDFVLYGGTAIALWLGHRQSIDFDFFSTVPFNPAALIATVPFLAGATLRQSAANTLTVTVERDGPVQLSFFGGLSLGQVAPHDQVKGHGLTVASLIDLAGFKAAVVTQRAEVKDYLDLHALLTDAAIPLPAMMSAAAAIYGDAFSPLLSLKAISYHDDPSLEALPLSVRHALVAAVRAVDLLALPDLGAIRPRRISQ